VLKKLIISIALFLAFTLTAVSQYYAAGLSSSFNLPKTQYEVDSTTGQLRFKPGDIGFTMQVGTGFASNFNGKSSFNTYVSPALAYNVSSRFRMKAGVMVFNNFGDPYYAGSDYYYSPVMNSGTTTSVYLQGDYLLSNKLMLSGAVYKDFSTLNTHPTDPGYKAPESQGMIFNVNYRPTQHVEINASFEYGNGNRSMLHSPFYPGNTFSPSSPW
jgi:hypothetical protein